MTCFFSGSTNLIDSNHLQTGLLSQGTTRFFLGNEKLTLNWETTVRRGKGEGNFLFLIRMENKTEQTNENILGILIDIRKIDYYYVWFSTILKKKIKRWTQREALSHQRVERMMVPTSAQTPYIKRLWNVYTSECTIDLCRCLLKTPSK